jgi:hypothetical protein
MASPCSRRNFQRVWWSRDGDCLKRVCRATSLAKDCLRAYDETPVLYDLTTAEQLGDSMKCVRRGCTNVRASTNMVTTRYRSNSAWIDLDTCEITAFFGIRPGCQTNNNLYPANGVMNMPNLTAGCTCNFAPASVACVPARWGGVNSRSSATVKPRQNHQAFAGDQPCFRPTG